MVRGGVPKDKGIAAKGKTLRKGKGKKAGRASEIKVKEEITSDQEMQNEGGEKGAASSIVVTRVSSE